MRATTRCVSPRACLMCMCELICICVRADMASMSVCVCASACERAYIYVRMYQFVCMYECARRFHRSLRVCACVRVCMRARGGGTPICTMCVCNDACTSRHVWMRRYAHAHTHRRLHLRLPVAISSCIRVRMDVYACVDGLVWTGVRRYTYICVYIRIPISPYITMLCLFYHHLYACMYARTWVCMGTLRTQVSMCECPQTDATRFDGCTCISRRLFI